MEIRFLNTDGALTCRVQRKNKRGKLGVKLQVEDVPPMRVVAMVLEARNRFRIWYIDKNQNIYPGTRHIKLNVGERLPTINIDMSVDGVRNRWPEMKIMSPTRGAIATGNNFTIERPK